MENGLFRLVDDFVRKTVSFGNGFVRGTALAWKTVFRKRSGSEKQLGNGFVQNNGFRFETGFVSRESRFVAENKA